MGRSVVYCKKAKKGDRMNLLILSDTHGRSDRIVELLDRPAVRPDAILFAGDGVRDFQYLSLPCPLYAVKGNNDILLSPINGDLPKNDLILDMEGCRILLTHGHLHGVKEQTTRLLMQAIQRKADVVIFGHTHNKYQEYIPAGERVGSVVTDHPIWLFNPGSLGDWQATFGTLEIRNGKWLTGFGQL
jgi:putative phosphoesterase